MKTPFKKQEERFDISAIIDELPIIFRQDENIQKRETDFDHLKLSRTSTFEAYNSGSSDCYGYYKHISKLIIPTQ